jgi:alkylation response protein AidB-like acyl-CoA dehydrogenase
MALDTAPMSPVEVAHALTPAIRASIDEIERGRRLPLPLAQAMAGAGLFRLLVPRSLGGSEEHPTTVIRTIEEVARVDGSAGWCLMIGATSALVSAYLPEPVARTIYAADPAVITGGALAPTGTATVDGSGYRVNGRWAFGSGVEHCAWLIANCVVMENGRPVMTAAGSPEIRIALVPAAEVEVVDTWTVAGLRGTGSHDFAIVDRWVPTERTVDLPRDAPLEPGTLYRFPLFGLLALGVAATITGMARGAIDALVELAAAKVPTGSRRVLRERVHAQMQVAQAEALLRSARAFLFDAIDEVWRAAESGVGVTPEHRALLRLAAAHAATSGAEVVDLMYHAGGASSIYASNPLQRFFRDVHTATQHTMVSPSIYETAGRLFLGLESDTAML